MIVAAFLLAALVVLCVSCQNEVEYVYEPSISLAAMPNKTSYFVGESLDLTGLRISCVQKDGSVIDVPESDYTTQPEQGAKLEKAERRKVTVTYKSRTLSFEVAVSEVTASRLYLKTAPKSAYYDGESIELSNVELTLLKTDGSEETISNFTAEPADGTPLFLQEETEGGVATSNITLSYGDLSCSFDVSVYAVQLRSLVIKSPPAQTTYYVGDTLDLAGLALEAAFSDGTVRNVAGECHISSETTFTEEGNHTVTVSFLGTECAFPVTVLQSFFKFCEQPPQDTEIPLYAENRTLSAKVMPDCDGNVAFSWYRKLPNESIFTRIAESKPVAAAYGVAVANELALPKTDYMTAEYYCVATLTRGTLKKTVESGVATVVQKVKTELPVVYIETDNGVSIVDKVTEVPMNMQVVAEDNDEANYKGTVRIRGNATAGYPKKPYKIKLSSKAQVLGMPENKSWVLLANYCDKTLMRTAIGFKTSELLNLAWTPRARFVELIVNGEYLGNYQLTESVKEGKNRVAINDNIKKGDYGYLIEKDNYYAQEPVWFRTNSFDFGYSFKFPDNEDITPDIKGYIENYVNEFEHVLELDNSEAFDETVGYQKYIDLDSWVRWFLVQNVVSNLDSNYYMYKKDLGDLKLCMGPVWDFEWSIGIGWYDGSRPNPDHKLVKPIYFERMLEDSHFKGRVKEIWNAEYSNVKSSLLDYVEELRTKLDKSQKANFTRWDIMNSVVSVGGVPMGSYDKEVDCDKIFLSEHIDWLDDAIKAL